MKKYSIMFDGFERSKQEIYDHLCAILTIYENPDDYDEDEHVTEDDLYSLLVEVTNNWGFLMSDDYR